MTSFLLFLLGLGLLVIGGRGVVNNALAIASRLKLPPLIIGITIVAIGTSLPEIVVSFFGGLDKATDLALGNIIGSNISNIGLIFGLSLLLNGLYIGSMKTQKNMIFYLVLSIAFFLILLFSGLNPIQGVFFLLFGFFVLIWQIIQGRKGVFEEDKEIFEELSKIGRNPVFACLLFVSSLALLVGGSKLVVDSGVEIAHLLGVSPFMIGITVIAVGTSLPELSVSLVGIAAREEKLVVGNILGSNIYNILLGGGILGLFGTDRLEAISPLIFFIIFSFFFCFLIYAFKGRKISRYFGFAMLGFYVIYLWVIFILQ